MPQVAQAAQYQQLQALGTLGSGNHFVEVAWTSKFRVVDAALRLARGVGNGIGTEDHAGATRGVECRKDPG